ncbi:hypothetical protein [Micromonospora globispora]|nr:hypothetical protein [Micromonospora globispora]
MTDSPDDSHGPGPRRRAYGEPARRGGRPHRVGPAPAPAEFPSGGIGYDGWLRDLSPATLTSVAVGLIVVVVIAALTFFSASRHPEPAPPAAEGAVDVGSPETAQPELPPALSFSPAPVFLSTRASMPSRAPSPTRRPTHTSTHSPRPTASASSPTPRPTLPRPGELTPLPPSQESSLKSSGGGPETFIDFVNARSETVVVHWLDYGGQRQQYAILQPGQWYRQQTYVGHPWVVTNAQGVGLVCFLPAYETLRAVVR